jgi:hypothetical protein
MARGRNNSTTDLDQIGRGGSKSRAQRFKLRADKAWEKYQQGDPSLLLAELKSGGRVISKSGYNPSLEEVVEKLKLAIKDRDKDVEALLREQWLKELIDKSQSGQLNEAQLIPDIVGLKLQALKRKGKSLLNPDKSQVEQKIIDQLLELEAGKAITDSNADIARLLRQTKLEQLYEKISSDRLPDLELDDFEFDKAELSLDTLNRAQDQLLHLDKHPTLGRLFDRLLMENLEDSDEVKGLLVSGMRGAVLARAELGSINWDDLKPSMADIHIGALNEAKEKLLDEDKYPDQAKLLDRVSAVFSDWWGHDQWEISEEQVKEEKGSAQFALVRRYITDQASQGKLEIPEDKDDFYPPQAALNHLRRGPEVKDFIEEATSDYYREPNRKDLKLIERRFSKEAHSKERQLLRQSYVDHLTEKAERAQVNNNDLQEHRFDERALDLEQIGPQTEAWILKEVKEIPYFASDGAKEYLEHADQLLKRIRKNRNKSEAYALMEKEAGYRLGRATESQARNFITSFTILGTGLDSSRIQERFNIDDGLAHLALGQDQSTTICGKAAESVYESETWFRVDRNNEGPYHSYGDPVELELNRERSDMPPCKDCKTIVREVSEGRVLSTAELDHVYQNSEKIFNEGLASDKDWASLLEESSIKAGEKIIDRVLPFWEGMSDQYLVENIAGGSSGSHELLQEFNEAQWSAVRDGSVDSFRQVPQFSSNELRQLAKAYFANQARDDLNGRRALRDKLKEIIDNKAKEILNAR